MSINFNNTNQTITASDSTIHLTFNTIAGVKLPINSFTSIELIENNTGFITSSPIQPLVLNSSSGGNLSIDFNKKLHYVDSNHNAIISNTEIEYLKDHIAASISQLNTDALADISVIEANASLQLGSIVMWSGTTLPAGFIFCNGTSVNGFTAPDLRGRFVIGASTLTYGGWVGAIPQTTKSFKIGNYGGESDHVLKTSEMPEHKHVVQWGEHWKIGGDWGYYGSGNNFGGGGSDDQDNVWRYSSPAFDPDADETSTESGSGVAHNNMPKYYSLAFIMYVGT